MPPPTLNSEEPVRRRFASVRHSTLKSCACGNLALFTSLHNVGELPVDEV